MGNGCGIMKMLSLEIVDQFLKDIHGEDGREVLMIFYDYLEENGVSVRRRRVRDACNIILLRVGISLIRYAHYEGSYFWGCDCDDGRRYNFVYNQSHIGIGYGHHYVTTRGKFEAYGSGYINQEIEW